MNRWKGCRRAVPALEAVHPTHDRRPATSRGRQVAGKPWSVRRSPPHSMNRSGGLSTPSTRACRASLHSLLRQNRRGIGSLRPPIKAHQGRNRGQTPPICDGSHGQVPAIPCPWGQSLPRWAHALRGCRARNAPCLPSAAGVTTRAGCRMVMPGLCAAQVQIRKFT